MGIVELFLIAVGLSMDAFAVSICKGLGMTKFRAGNATVIALFFGGFQALMPLIGWFLGSRFQKYIVNFDHWVAFGLLVFIGVQMIIESRKEEEEVTENGDVLKIKELFLLAIATSIDALAIGITFALLPGTNIWLSILLIGITTFVISFGGVGIGFFFGNKYEKKAQVAGGIILIALGIKILLEHLGVLTF
ncbi:MAG: manganese efflux pump MntP family protein [Butyribacter sp.]|nr:manganese efflux pump MntP family protein [bacterium]MDY3853665.1 manganese efflux pump MntP family protein [Butyribacter sp.]